MKTQAFIFTFIFLMGGILFWGCKNKSEGQATGAAEEEKKATTAPSAPQPPPAEPEEAPPPKQEEPATKEAQELEENCNALYEAMKAVVEKVQEKLGPHAPKKPFPPRERIIEACKQLPFEVARCMNPQIMMKKRMECDAIMKKADQEQIRRFKMMMQ